MSFVGLDKNQLKLVT